MGNQRKWLVNCFFAADTGAGGGSAADTAQDNTQESSGEQQAEKTFTQAEVDKLIVERLARENRKNQEETAKAIEQTRTEAERLAKMSAEERAKAESEKAQRETQAKLDAIAKREIEITQRELKAETLQTLAEKSLPAGLVSCVNMTDAETCTESIAAIEKAFRDAVQAGIDEHIKKHGGVPKAGSANTTAAIDAAFGLTGK